MAFKLYFSLILVILASSVLASHPTGQPSSQHQGKEEGDFQVVETDEKIVIVEDKETTTSAPAAKPKPLETQIVKKIDLKPLLLKKLGPFYDKFGLFPEYGVIGGVHPKFGFGPFPGHGALYPGLRPVGVQYPGALPFSSNYPFGFYRPVPARYIAGFIPRNGPVINDELITINVNIPETKCQEKVTKVTKKQDKATTVHKKNSKGGHHHKQASKEIHHHKKSTAKGNHHEAKGKGKGHHHKANGKGHHHADSGKGHHKESHSKGSHHKIQKKPEIKSSSSSSELKKTAEQSSQSSSAVKHQHTSQHSGKNQYKPKPVPKTATTTTTEAPAATTPKQVYRPVKKVSIKKESESKKTTKENEENSQLNYTHEKKSGNGKNEESNSLSADENGKSLSSEEYNKKHFQSSKNVY